MSPRRHLAPHPIHRTSGRPSSISGSRSPTPKPRKILDDKLTEYATLMRVTRQTAQRDFTDERLLAFAQSPRGVTPTTKPPAPT